MSLLVLYHNPKCSKSRSALEILRDREIDHQVVEYLKTPLERADLGVILDALGTSPADLVRKDGHFDELGLDAADYTERTAVIDILLEHPRLMQRPIALREDRAVIGRPPERVLELADQAPS